MIRVQIDPASLRATKKLVRDFQKKTGKNIEDCIVEIGRSGAKQLAQKVPPFGLSASVGKRFEGSIAKQVNRAITAANVGVVRGGTAAGAHDAARDSRGQVPRTLRTKGKRVPDPISVRDKEREVDKSKRAAGNAKGAWIAAGNQLGATISGIARWVSRHLSNGRGRITRRGMSTEVTLTNQLDYIQRLQPQRLVKSAMQAAFSNTLRRMQRILSKS